VFPQVDQLPSRDRQSTVSSFKFEDSWLRRVINPQTTRTTIRLGDVKSRWALPVLIGVSAVVAAWVLYLTSYKNFFYDEWSFISSRRPWQLNALLLPHNGHWTTLPILLWKLLFVTVGLRSHLPYQAALLAVHIAAVCLLFALIRRRSGDIPALGSAVILLVLGSGADDIVWAFQVTAVGSVAFGLLAMLLLEGDPPFPGRLAPVSVALLCSLMCSSVGLAFLVAVAAELLADRRRRRFMLVLALPTVAFAEWFLALDTGLVQGSSGVSQDLLHGATGFSYIVDTTRFVVRGLGASAAGVFGAPEIAGIALLVALIVLVALNWNSTRRVESWQIGSFAGFLFFFALIAFGRVQLGTDLASQTRYVYVGVVFLLPLFADALRALPWSGLWRPALVATFMVCILGNVVRLHDVAVSQLDFMRTENAELQTVQVFRGAPDMAAEHYIDDTTMPQLRADTYLAASDELGSPVPPATTESLRQLPSYAVDRVMLNLFGSAVVLGAGGSISNQNLPCRSVDASTGSTMDLQVADGHSVMLQSVGAGDASLYLSFLGPPPEQPQWHIHLEPSSPAWVHLPETGKHMNWRLRVQTTKVGVVLVCGATNVELGQPLS
jgi:hypothetical protein